MNNSNIRLTQVGTKSIQSMNHDFNDYGIRWQLMISGMITECSQTMTAWMKIQTTSDMEHKPIVLHSSPFQDKPPGLK